ncbi:MAG: glycosyltransferase family 4 protein, partial [Bacteroidota bacterium]
PLQLIFLKFSVGKRCKFIVRHHGENPFRGIKGLFQKFADQYIDSYLFTSFNNAAEWKNVVIKDPGKCVEILEASTNFSRQELLKSQAITGVTGMYNFLWVGRLIKGKDPFTVLAAFDQYARQQPDARLYMIYQDEELLGDIKKIISQNKRLGQAVKLIGKIDNKDLAYWYSAANFYISGSHSEAAGYAVLEAMACGCIPVVTSIPSFVKMTHNGDYGFLYSPGDAIGLAALLKNLVNVNIEAYRSKVENYFREHLSFKNIAADIISLCKELYSKQR